MSLNHMRFGIFLAPFHPMDENPTLCIDRDMAFCNAVRPHSTLGARIPDQIHFDQPLLAAA